MTDLLRVSCYQEPLRGYFWLARYCYRSQPPDCIKIGSRRIFLGLELNWKWDSEQIRTLYTYSGFTNVKLPRLYSTYAPPGIVELTRKRFLKRIQARKKAFISVGFNFGVGAKTSLTQTGECLSGVGFYAWPGEKGYELRVNLFLRSSEIGRRLIGDLLFLDEIMTGVLQGTGFKNFHVKINLGSAYVHSMHWMLWRRMYPQAAEEKPDREFTNRLRRCEREQGGIKYGPFQRACSAYLGIKKKRLPALFSFSDGQLRVHDGNGQHSG